MESLPPELLIAVFEYLPYDDLKLRIALVSRRFKQTLESALKVKRGKIAQNLFIDEIAPNHSSIFLHMNISNCMTDAKLTEPIILCNTTALHPMLSKITYNSSYAPEDLPRELDDPENLRYFDEFRLNGRSLSDYEGLLSENVFSPACAGVPYRTSFTTLDPAILSIDEHETVRPLKVKTLLGWYKKTTEAHIKLIRSYYPAIQDMSERQLAELHDLQEFTRGLYRWTGNSKVAVCGSGEKHLILL